MVVLKDQRYEYIKEPVRLTFFISVILSLIAIFGTVTVGKDGAFYVDIARSISNNGLSVAFDRFDWPWYSILIAAIHGVTKINHEIIAYFCTVLFMAGTCSLIVSMVKKKNPEAVYWAVLLVLSVPVFNAFRAEIIRETGFWFFTVLALWLVLLDSKITFMKGLSIQLAIVAAALFRLEALFIIPAVFIYLLFKKDIGADKNKFLNLFNCFYGFYILFFLCFLAVVGTGLLDQPRVARNLDLINPYVIYDSFFLVSDGFAQTMLLKWSHSDAAVIVFFGFLVALIIRIISYAGIASLVLLDSTGRKGLIEGAKNYKLNIISIALYFLVLLVFFFQVKFINSRYSALLLILSVPILTVAVYHIKFKWPKLTNAFVFLSLVLMFANVISTSTKKTHYLEAAQWIKENTSSVDKIYYEDSRVAYYAGRGYPSMPLLTDVLEDNSHIKNYGYLVMESDVDDKAFLQWIAQNKLMVVAEKSNGKKTMFILANKSNTP